MIDIIVNETGGLTVAHDERALDSFVTLDLDMADGAMTLGGPDGVRFLGRLAPSMREFVRDGAGARMVRVSGMSIPRSHVLALNVTH